jgi:tRNA(Phe) wybutosine-synthesizing methylase Tyw3
MPTVLRSGPYRLFFYAGDGSEPPHVHVERDNCEATLWLDPVRLGRSHGFAASEINSVERLIVENQQYLLGAWNEFFNG